MPDKIGAPYTEFDNLIEQLPMLSRVSHQVFDGVRDAVIGHIRDFTAFFGDTNVMDDWKAGMILGDVLLETIHTSCEDLAIKAKDPRYGSQRPFLNARIATLKDDAFRVSRIISSSMDSNEARLPERNRAAFREMREQYDPTLRKPVASTAMARAAERPSLTARPS